MTQYSERELQLKLLYSIIVAGKNSKFAENIIKRFFPKNIKPFDFIRQLIDKDLLMDKLKEMRVGNYSKHYKCFLQLSKSSVNLNTCSPEQLESIHGIGPKTARFFIIWTRPNEEYAALDVHILRWLKSKGYNVPTSTPSGKKYKEIEQYFLKEAKLLNIPPAQLDAKIWMAGSKSQEWNPNFK
jgi:thermostable 8-oxoguanine DNA glycosylase